MTFRLTRDKFTSTKRKQHGARRMEALQEAEPFAETYQSTRVRTMESITSTCDHKTGTFEQFNEVVQKHFASLTAGLERQILTVPTDGLFDIYLSGFEEAERQEHNCHCCRRFIEQFGGLVIVSDDGELHSVMWPADDRSQYGPSSRLMARKVGKSKISGVFMTNTKALGVPTQGGWSHFSVPVSPILRRDLRDERLHAEICLKLQDMQTLQHGLADFSADTINTALGLLRSESLYRSEKVLGPCEWLSSVRAQFDSRKGSRRANLMWRAVAAAPVGFCTPRSSMVGTLLEDIASGMAFDDVKRRFAAKMDPLQYQRPQVPATAGNIAAAERVIAELGLEPALRRRFARLDEIRTIWKPTEKVSTPTKGVFGHLVAKSETKPVAIKANAGVITWDKFQRAVLPTAEAIEFHISSGTMNWCAMLTAVNADAPPILQWDREDTRNPVSWYVYNGGSPSSRWGIEPHKFAKVSAVSLQPSMWNGGNEHQGRGVIFIIDGAVDSHKPGVCLFPEILRTELHSIRTTIEAYSRDSVAEGREDASACGILIGNGQGQSNRIRVTSSTGIAEYVIDRLD